MKSPPSRVRSLSHSMSSQTPSLAISLLKARLIHSQGMAPLQRNLPWINLSKRQLYKPSTGHPISNKAWTRGWSPCSKTPCPLNSFKALEPSKKEIRWVWGISSAVPSLYLTLKVSSRYRQQIKIIIHRHQPRIDLSWLIWACRHSKMCWNLAM